MSKTRILDAVRRLDTPAAKSLLDSNPALISAADPSGKNLLHVACMVHHQKLGLPPSASVRLASLLLDQGLEIDAPFGKDACTPLFFAVARGRNPALAKFLMEHGAKPSNAPGHGLFAAGWWDDVKSLDLLLRAGAEIDTETGDTPFLAAWCWKRFAAARFLAIKGANVNFQDKKGRTALHHGVEKEFDPAQLRWLVRHGASPEIKDADGVSALTRASRKRNKAFFKALRQ